MSYVRRYLPLGLFVLAASAAGCSSVATETKPARFPTRGTLTYNGQPPRGAIVTFWPLPLEKNDWRTVKPQAMVEADGSYQPNSYDLKDGAMKGEYAVTVIWTGENNEPAPDLLKGRFSDPKRPVLKVTITEGENVIPPIQLTGGPVNLKIRDNGGI